MVMSFNLMYTGFCLYIKKINYKEVSSRIRDITRKLINCTQKRKKRVTHMGDP